MKALKIENLHISFDKQIISNLSLSADLGERLVIIGPSGCGKSSIFKAILRQIEYQGTIAVDGDVGYLPQSLALFEHMTVEQNVKLPLVIKNNPAEIEPELFERFGLSNVRDKYIHQLSGGQAQRVALMRALVSDGQILLFDEPLSKVDQITKHKLIDYFDNFIDENHLLIYITHDLYEAAKLATRILVLTSKPLILDNDIPVDEMVAKLTELLFTNEMEKNENSNNE